MLAAVFVSSGANARSCGRASQDNPMAWNEGFGASQCRVRRPRYHSHDYDGEGARGYTAASDPMTWPDSQWHSTLMDGYSRTYDSRYDRRFRRESTGTQIRVERQIEVTIRQNGEAIAPEPQPRRPKLLNMRSASDFKANTGVLRFGGHDCHGVLVLTWGSLGSKMRCYTSGGRIKTR